ncbi:MAG: hypothetical protein R3C49_12130 [Planctomycetaceae bacterium]
MESEKLRREICFAAARLLHTHRESTFRSARQRALRALTRSFVDRDALPTDMEIRMALQQLVGTEFASDASDVPSAFTMHGVEADDEIDEASDRRFDCYLALLKPLESVVPDRELHPEGDLLYHSLQVFERWRRKLNRGTKNSSRRLCCMIGRGIDPRDAHQAGIATIHSVAIGTHAGRLFRTCRCGIVLPKGQSGCGLVDDWSSMKTEIASAAGCCDSGRVPGRRTEVWKTPFNGCGMRMSGKVAAVTVRAEHSDPQHERWMPAGRPVELQIIFFCRRAQAAGGDGFGKFADVNDRLTGTDGGNGDQSITTPLGDQNFLFVPQQAGCWSSAVDFPQCRPA